ncbi:MAG: sigma 54-interacting transcriptional regulator [Pirellulaceae bacterium]|nr:sigma 54-interacting transcriptional regulator [Pirellulaceae bacterium]
MTCSLLLLNGPTPGTTVRLDPTSPEVTIGRHHTRELQLDDERVSRLHAKVIFEEEQWHVVDCESTNGTSLNAQPVNRALLEAGDLIRIGERLILFVKNLGVEDEDIPEPVQFKSTTLFGRLPPEGQASPDVEQDMSATMSRVVRDLTVLCRLANQLHHRSSTSSLVSVSVDAIVDGISADSVIIWLVGVDGRLRRAGGWSTAEDWGDDHVLASLAIEKNKVIRLEEPSNDVEETIDDVERLKTRSNAGLGMGVPIPGQGICRGAIECRRLPDRKPFSSSDLDFAVVVAHQTGLALENLEHRERLERANEELRQQIAKQSSLTGSSPIMQDVLDQITRVGPTDSTVLVLGESGTGKELVARSIHDSSRHSAGPFIAVNCAAFSESLLESELFGHEAGAFTGADRRRIGQFERAHRGTIFLDEVGEMTAACQAKLLRLLEGHPFERVGGHESITVDVRVVAATHRDLADLVKQGKFRSDLFYRLRVIDMHLPPLRERGDDVMDLASQFLEHFNLQIGRGPRRLSAEAVDAIRRYEWPGNVRELKNSVERAVVLARTEEIMPIDLGITHLDTGTEDPPEMIPLRDAERRHIDYVLWKVNGNKTEACRILGISRATLYAKLEDKSGTNS